MVPPACPTRTIPRLRPSPPGFSTRFSATRTSDAQLGGQPVGRPSRNPQWTLVDDKTLEVVVPAGSAFAADGRFNFNSAACMPAGLAAMQNYISNGLAVQCKLTGRKQPARNSSPYMFSATALRNAMQRAQERASSVQQATGDIVVQLRMRNEPSSNADSTVGYDLAVLAVTAAPGQQQRRMQLQVHASDAHPPGTWHAVPGANGGPAALEVVLPADSPALDEAAKVYLGYACLLPRGLTSLIELRLGEAVMSTAKLTPQPYQTTDGKLGSYRFSSSGLCGAINASRRRAAAEHPGASLVVRLEPAKQSHITSAGSTQSYSVVIFSQQPGTDKRQQLVVQAKDTILEKPPKLTSWHATTSGALHMHVGSAVKHSKFHLTLQAKVPTGMQHAYLCLPNSGEPCTAAKLVIRKAAARQRTPLHGYGQYQVRCAALRDLINAALEEAPAGVGVGARLVPLALEEVNVRGAVLPDSLAYRMETFALA